MSAFFKRHDSCILHQYVQIAQSVEHPFNLRVQGSSPCLGTTFLWGFPGSSAGKESTCNAGDRGSTLGSGRSAGEGIGYPLQYSWAFPVAQLVKNPPAMRETWVRSLGWEDAPEKGKATHSSILACRIPWTIPMGSQRVWHDWVTFTWPDIYDLLV